MKNLVEIIAVNLDRLKAKNPLHFALITLSMILLVIALDTVPFFSKHYSEGFIFLKYLLMTVTGFSSTSTYSYLPSNHPKKLESKSEGKNISLSKNVANES